MKPPFPHMRPEHAQNIAFHEIFAHRASTPNTIRRRICRRRLLLLLRLSLLPVMSEWILFLKSCGKRPRATHKSRICLFHSFALQKCDRYSRVTHSILIHGLVRIRNYISLNSVHCVPTYLLLWLISCSLHQPNTFFSNILLYSSALSFSFGCAFVGCIHQSHSHAAYVSNNRIWKKEEQECFIYADNLCSIFCILLVRLHTRCC